MRGGNAWPPRAIAPSRHPTTRLAFPVGLAALLILYWLIAIRTASHAYLDYVDGYYLYVAHRMAQGAILYSGVMGVQPPGIYLVGAALFRLHDALATARAYAGVLHCFTILLVAATTFRLTANRAHALLGAAVYTLAPYGLIWSRTFDPNPLVTFLSLGSLWALLGLARLDEEVPGASIRWAMIAGLLAALALLTKVWYLPVGAASLWWLGRYRRPLLIPFVGAFLATLVIACGLGTLSAGTDFWRGLLVQDASSFSGSWFETSLYHVIGDDWPLLLLGLAGARLLWRGEEQGRLVALWALCSCAVILATAKEGTAWPVFQFAEPFLAICAAVLLVNFAAPRAAVRRRSSSAFVPLVGLVLLALFALPAIREASSWPARGEDAVALALQHAGTGNQEVLAPPFFLYLSGRRGLDQFADINLWELQARRGDERAVTALATILQALDHDQIPMVLADNRVMALAGVPAALRAHYRPLAIAAPLPPDRAVTVWVPR